MKCFYHNDLDGHASGSVVALWLNKNEINFNKSDFIEVDYQKPLDEYIEKISNGEKVFFVDYSFKDNTKYVLYDLIYNKNCDVIWIDHHTSSINLQNNYIELKNIMGIRSDNYSGAVLSYMYLFDCDYYDDVPMYLKYVDDYDCWKFNLKDTMFFKLGIEINDNDALDEIWEKLYNESNYINNYNFDSNSNLAFTDSLIQNGKIVDKYVTNENKFYKDNFAYETIIDGHKCLAVNKKSNSKIFGDDYNNYPLVMTYVFNGDRFVYSIFSSNEDIDCSEIAESYGGGGHKGAAGFMLEHNIFHKIN